MTLQAKMLAAIVIVLVLVSTAHADTYGTFKTTRYYSPNRMFFIEVTKDKRAVFYRNAGRPRRLWVGQLPELPGEMLVTNDGKRLVSIDRYYGNGNDPRTPVVIFLDDKGRVISRHLLSDVANLKRVLRITSSTHWYKNAKLTPNENHLVIETVVAKRDQALCARVNSPEEAEECTQSTPFEQLRFAMTTGKLLSRTNSNPGEVVNIK